MLSGTFTLEEVERELGLGDRIRRRGVAVFEIHKTR